VEPELTYDKLETDPKHARPQTERLDPPIVEAVTLKTPPRTVRDATEMVLPQRPNPTKDSVLPIAPLPKTDVLEPIRAIPAIDIDDPNLECRLNERELPITIMSTVETESPSLTKLKRDNVLPNKTYSYSSPTFSPASCCKKVIHHTPHP
jgi:hypothetical protein